jgi:hypothetical protein
MGRRAHKPDAASRRQIEAMAAYGVPELDIAEVIGVDPKTLRKHYRAELRQGHTKANSRVAESLYRKATSEGPQSVTAAIFWLKTRAAWRETSVHEVSGPGGEPFVSPDPRDVARAILRILSTATLVNTPDELPSLPSPLHHRLGM